MRLCNINIFKLYFHSFDIWHLIHKINQHEDDFKLKYFPVERSRGVIPIFGFYAIKYNEKYEIID